LPSLGVNAELKMHQSAGDKMHHYDLALVERLP